MAARRGETSQWLPDVREDTCWGLLTTSPSDGGADSIKESSPSGPLSRPKRGTFYSTEGLLSITLKRTHSAGVIGKMDVLKLAKCSRL